jgi:hypothetical protein
MHMSLVVSAEVIRDLIIEGDYLMECLEQRERGGVLLTLTLRSRAQPYSLQIETTDHKLEGLFRALLHANAKRSGDKPTHRIGSQSVPVVEVDSLPADHAKPRRRRAPQAAQIAAQTAKGAPAQAERRQAALRQLTLVPEASPARPEPSSAQPGKRRGRARSSHTGERL